MEETQTDVVLLSPPFYCTGLVTTVDMAAGGHLVTNYLHPLRAKIVNGKN